MTLLVAQLAAEFERIIHHASLYHAYMCNAMFDDLWGKA